MCDEWYYSTIGKIVGPVSFQGIRELAACGRIVPTTPIREGVVGRWILAGNIRELLDFGSRPMRTEIQASDDEPLVGVTVLPEGTITSRVPVSSGRRSMALTTCPDCGHQVSRRAIACPCAAHLSARTNRQLKHPRLGHRLPRSRMVQW